MTRTEKTLATTTLREAWEHELFNFDDMPFGPFELFTGDEPCNSQADADALMLRLTDSRESDLAQGEKPWAGFENDPGETEEVLAVYREMIKRRSK